MLNKSLEYIWKNTHSAGVKIQMYHYKVNNKFECDKELKRLLTDRKFKWKKIVNEVGTRFEVLETLNKDFADQTVRARPRSTAAACRERMS
jgi:hypothetical protein